MYSATIIVNMTHFNSKFKVFSDNVDIYEKILESKGNFFTLDYRKITETLCEFNIFFTRG